MTTKIRKMNGLVVYFDIYGFSDLLSKVSNNGRNLPLYPNFNSVEELSKEILAIWEWISLELNKPYVTTYLFSDCGFIVYPTTPEMLNSCTADLTSLYSEFLRRGFFLRGGISYGEVFTQNNFLTGKVVIEAVKLESISPGPFILLPYNITNTLLKADKLISEVNFKFQIIETKSKSGKIKAHLILPSDKGEFFNKLREYSEYYVENGPWEYGKFWHDTYEFVKTYLSTEVQDATQVTNTRKS